MFPELSRSMSRAVTVFSLPMPPINRTCVPSGVKTPISSLGPIRVA
jgi:hypothetical protein